MLLTLSELTEKARTLALEHQVVRGSQRSWRREMQSFSDRAKVLDAFCRSLREKGTNQLQSGEEWLLDHTDFIAEQVAITRKALRGTACQSLPFLESVGSPRFIEVCSVYAEATDGEFSEVTFVAFMNAYQDILPFTLQEVWLLLHALRMALISKLCAVARFIEERRDVADRTDRLIQALKTSEQAEEQPPPISEQQMETSGPLLAALVSRMQQGDDEADLVRAWVTRHFTHEQDRLEGIVGYEHTLRSAYQVTIGNIITSLRTLNLLDWRRPFQQLSIVDKMLLRESTGDYANLDFSSQDTLRHRVEQLAKRWNLAQTVVAETAVQLANDRWSAHQGKDTPSRSAFVAFYLNDGHGVGELKRAVESRRGAKGATGWIPGARKVSRYFSFMALVTACVLFLMAVSMLDGASASTMDWVWVCLACLIPASEWGVAFVHWCVECTVRPTPLLRYDFSEGIPAEATTLVVIPVIWSSEEDVADILKRLERHHVSTRDPHVHYAILGDFSDAAESTMATDRAITDLAIAGIQHLNKVYGFSGSTFHLFHRKRVWNDSERQYMGWERKRGKLVEFVELLRGSTHTSYHVVEGNVNVVPDVRYVVTLDSDTTLPIGCVQRMVATMHLPYNRPRLNTARTRVVAGYGILQPRVGVRHSASTRSWLARLWSGNPGIDPYAFALSDPYQDAFGEGIFTGKGIFDVDSFHQVLCSRIPDNRVLSHDLLEGGFLRAGLLSDVEVLDDYPATFSTYQQRLERWVRGDWQLIPWLGRQSNNRLGEKQSIDLGPLTKWQIIDNLRRSLLQITLFVVLTLGLWILPGHPARWLVLVGLTLCIPLIRHCASLHRVLRDPAGLILVFLQTVTLFLFLPIQVAWLGQAIGKTLYRLAISKRNLLEWVSSRQLDALVLRGEQRIRLHGLYSGWGLIADFLGVGLLFGKPSSPWIAILFGCLWFLAPVYAALLDRPFLRSRVKLTTEETTRLIHLAERTWSFFQVFAGAEDHFLPPDNMQIDPPVGVAHRTSPTNIGMLLTAYVAAVDLGFITRNAAVESIQRTVTTIEALVKWDGHLLNWYDTRTLHPLPPRYVSTVDSGNLVVALIVVEQALLEWKSTLADDHGVDQLVNRVHTLIHQTDFRPLFDGSAGLLSLGYHVDQNRRETILYDLVASENRQASFVAIALGQIPMSHWFQLNRTMTKVRNVPTLLSWTGTMFEYLMPALFMRTYQNTIWEKTYRGVVHAQRTWAGNLGVPFGISESGYYAFDAQMNYQYHAFGVPGLGFKRGLEQDLVISPYAAVLALPFSGKAGLSNLLALEDCGASGEYGYFEAIDWTPRRLPVGKSNRIIKSYMAHHQGMLLLALTNLLCNESIISRFHSSVEVEAAELLLQERVPKRPNVIPNPTIASIRLPLDHPRKLQPLQTFDVPACGREVSLLSSGSVTTMVDTLGSGFIKWKGRLLNRWSPDWFENNAGLYLYIHDLDERVVWSPLNASLRQEDQQGHISFYDHMAEFEGTFCDLSARVEVCVSPESAGDVRVLTLTNCGNKTKRVEITSFLELAMADPMAYKAHPTFSKLFIGTELDERTGCLVATRRPRSSQEVAWHAAHALVVQQGTTLGPVEYETNRATFIGRGQSPTHPQALGRKLNASVGSVADPAFCMRQTVEIPPGQVAHLLVATTVAEEKDDAVQAVGRLCEDRQGQRAQQFSWNFAGIEKTHLGVSDDLAVQSALMAARLLYPTRLANATQLAIRKNVLDTSALWSLGISGDLPILLLTQCDANTLPFLTTVLRCQQYLARKGFQCDVVVVAATGGGYQRNGFNAIEQTVGRFRDMGSVSRAGAICLCADDELAEDAKTLLQAVASVTLSAKESGLKTQLQSYAVPLEEDRESATVAVQVSRMPSSVEGPVVGGVRGEAGGGNGIGEFIEDGRSYRIHLRSGHRPQLPWSNVMANPHFGTLITELGTGYTWWQNSREFKLTPWRNDPIHDVPSEICFIRDERNGEFWSATPEPAHLDADWEVTHSHGTSRFVAETSGVQHDFTVFAANQDGVKIGLLTLTNQIDADRTLSVTYFADLVLGVDKDLNRRFVIPEWNSDVRCLLAKNRLQTTFRDACVVLGIHAGEEEQLSWTSDKFEFLGRSSGYESPLGMRLTSLSCSDGPVADACATVRTTFSMAPLETKHVIIVFGCAESESEAIRLWDRCNRLEKATVRRDEVVEQWKLTLGSVQVQTPNPLVNTMMNGWLLYQVLSCRMWARTGFYQAGGAYGFRDQLQDSLALLHANPAMVRNQILLHARHQFVEGDVQHWWHEETKKGIRTRFSDDLLWLPYAVSRYVEHTGDVAFLSVDIPYLTADELASGEDERYGDTIVSDVVGTLYDHCMRAVDRSLCFGEHGLPLMGSGDWNDGMNLVGPEGRGESVWLGWFLCDVLRRMEPLAEMMGDAPTSVRYGEKRVGLSEALNDSAWDGHWFRRAFTDAGTWLGSARDKECRIDAIAQAWSVISGAADQEKSQKSMQSVLIELVDPHLQIIRLLTPAFDASNPSPGYIQGYPPGLRENGGQYTHGVVWAVMALAMLGDASEAASLYEMLLPCNHTNSLPLLSVYQGEPYVMAADVYSEGPLAGRSGWTWYTGAAGWMYQVGLEWILGIQKRGQQLILRPVIPPDWNEASVTYVYGSTRYEIQMKRATVGAARLVFDGDVVPWTRASVNTEHVWEEELKQIRLSSQRAVRPTGTAVLIDGAHAPAIPLLDDGQVHKVDLWF